MLYLLKAVQKSINNTLKSATYHYLCVKILLTTVHDYVKLGLLLNDC